MTTLTAVCLTHRQAPLDLLEQFPRADALRPMLEALRRLSHVRGCLLLSTCNRFEIYVTSDVAPDLDDIVAAIATSVSVPTSDWVHLLEHHRDDTAVSHLFAVAAGLDSRLVGEHEILGQVRAAAHASAQAGCLDIDLATLSQWAVRAGRRARRALGELGSHASVADHSISVLDTMLGGLAGRRVLVVGAGRLASRAARRLIADAATTIVCARDVDKARVATGARSVTPIQLLPVLVGGVDAVICATSAATPLIDAAVLGATLQERARRPLLIVDLGVPRNVAPDVGRLDNVICLDLDALVTCDASAQAAPPRRAAAQRVVEAETAAYERMLSERAVADLLDHVIERARAVRESELLRAARRVGAAEISATDEVTRRVINKLLHPIVTGIKAAAASGDVELARAAAEMLCGKDMTALRIESRRSQAS